MAKKRRRKEEPPPPDEELPSVTTSSSGSSDSEEERTTADFSKPKSNDKYNIFKVPGYIRKYPEDFKKADYIIFLTHKDEQKSFNDKDRMSLSKGLRDHGVSGVMHLKSINKFKVGITFDLPNNANMFLQNNKLLDQLSLKASIPAKDTEVTGVLTSVPIHLSNKGIFSLIGSSKNVIQVRRFMRRVRTDGGAPVFLPTQAVAVTFASTVLPEYVHLDSWRHEVKVYVPPVKQCLKCLRYGHIAKFCRATEACSICSESHNYKQCTVDMKNATCKNCKGNHIAISSSCPIKKQKIEENKIKSHTATYSDLFNANSFPQLTARTLDVQVNNLLKSETFMNILIETITKIVSNKDVPINSNSIKTVLKTTLSNKLPPSA